VPDAFFALRVDWLFDFFEERKKSNVPTLCVDCKKCDRKKQQQGGCAEAGIKTVQAPLRQAQRLFGLLTWR